MSPLLEVRDLHRSFYGVTAVEGASFFVEPGTITGLIGPNGAGKTTAFNCITGVVPPEGGTVLFDGEDITGWAPERITGRGLVRTFQIARGFEHLSVYENLMVYGNAQPGESLWTAIVSTATARRREEELTQRALAIAQRLRLHTVIDNAASDLSGGQKKLLEIGRALMTEPKLILLDEPIAGVNRTLANEIAADLQALCAEGLTFLVIEHDMNMVARICDPVIVMAEGKDLVRGSFETIANDPRVQEAYMGKRRWAS